MNYLREAYALKPDNCVLYICVDGIEVEMFADLSVTQRTVVWGDIEKARVNPIMLAIEEMV